MAVLQLFVLAAGGQNLFLGRRVLILRRAWGYHDESGTVDGLVLLESRLRSAPF